MPLQRQSLPEAERRTWRSRLGACPPENIEVT